MLKCGDRTDSALWRSHRGEEIIAGFLTAAARLGAHPAVLVARGVVITFFDALVARIRASYDGSTGYVLQDRLPRQYPARRTTKICTVEVEPYATGQRS